MVGRFFHHEGDDTMSERTIEAKRSEVRGLFNEALESVYGPKIYQSHLADQVRMLGSCMVSAYQMMQDIPSETKGS